MAPSHFHRATETVSGSCGYEGRGVSLDNGGTSAGRALHTGQTGDLRGNLSRVTRELRRIRFPVNFDERGAKEGGGCEAIESWGLGAGGCRLWAGI